MESTKTYNKFSQRWEWKNSQGQYHRENDLPAIECDNGDKYWLLNNQIHRGNDLPAVEYVSGAKYWYLNGQLHRLNSPARIWTNGSIEYWYHGKRIDCKSNEEFMRLIKLECFW